MAEHDQCTDVLNDPEEDAQPSRDNTKIIISADNIQTTNMDTEGCELPGLDVRVYDQHVLEEGIHHQLDTALEHAEALRRHRDAQRRAKTLTNRILQLERQLSTVSGELLADEPRTYRQLLNRQRLQTQAAGLTVELVELRRRKEELLADATHQGSVGVASSSVVVADGNDLVDSRVRLGEMTPFGTQLATDEVDGLIVDCQSVQSKRDSSGKLLDAGSTGVSACTVESQSASAIPSSSQSARRPAIAGDQSDGAYTPSDVSGGQSDSDVEYVTSEDEGSSNKVQRGKKRRREAPAAISAKKKALKSRDDGDAAAYSARLKRWRCERREERLRRIEQGIVDGVGDDDSPECVVFDGFHCPTALWNKLFKYQQVCVRWLWELHQQKCGGILGDEMGMGKTIQVIAFLVGLAHTVSARCQDRGTLIVAPATVLHQWVGEFHAWWPPFRVAVLHDSGSHSGSRVGLARQICRSGAILVTSYSVVTSLKDQLTALPWQYVILDEGHKIRNPDAQVTLAVKQFSSAHRLILSGSPLQNNLRELWSLVDFVFPGKLGTLPVFMAQFAVPITQGGYSNASDAQVVTGYKCAKVLRDSISPYLLRRMKADVQQTLQLPSKNEQVLFCKLTDHQRELYVSYLTSDNVTRILNGRLKVFVGLIALRKLCNHPDLLDTGRCPPGGGADSLEGGHSLESGEVSQMTVGHWRLSGKMIVVEALLKMWRKQNHKVLLFTQSRQMLRILESFISRCEYAFVKMDGGTSVAARQRLISRFNSDPDIFIFLLTTRVGGLGVNLTGASRVLIYDPDWNPSTDLQARERAWRIGQQRSVTIYRLLTAGTIEEKIYHRQIFKQFLTSRVLKDPKQQRFFKSTDLHDLFSLTDDIGTEKPNKKSAKRPKTETAEIFASSQVSASAVERRMRDSKMRRMQQMQDSKMRERQLQKDKQERLRQMARKLNRKYFSSASTSSRTGVTSTGTQGVTATGTHGLTSADTQGVTTTTHEVTATGPHGVTSADTQGVTGTNEGTDIGTHGVTSADTQGVTATTHEVTGEGAHGVTSADTQGVTATNEGTDTGTRGINGGDSTSYSPSTSVEVCQAPPSVSEVNGGVGGSTSCPPPSTSVDFYQAPPSVSEVNGGGEPTASRVHRQRKLREEVTGEGRQRNRERRGRRESSRELGRARVEGERVPGLMEVSTYNAPISVETELQTSGHQDDYVLAKLFKKTGIHSALKHDVIEGQGTSEYAVYEEEATKVAREAVAALRESRRGVCAGNRAQSMVTWTGQNGTAGRPSSRPRFGQKRAGRFVRPEASASSSPSKSVSAVSADAVSHATTSSSEQLLERMRSRHGNDEAAQRHCHLVAEIRSFVAERCGRVSTDEILRKFRRQMPPRASPLFRALLMEICDFRRDSSGSGWWHLKQELL